MLKQEPAQSSRKFWTIENATLVDETDFRQGKDVLVEGSSIRKISASVASVINSLPSTEEKKFSIDGKQTFLYPGLINGFDNLLACYYPFDSPERPYANWLAYDNDLKSSDLFRERMLIDSETLYHLGSTRSLLGGITTVVDHIPHQIHRAFAEDLSIRLLPDFGINHSIGSYHLGWGKSAEEEHRYAKENDLPYILRVAEGTDRYSAQDIRRLEELKLLDSHTVLIHALNLSQRDIEVIAKAKAHIVWVPEVQDFLYQSSTPIASCLAAGIPISLATGPAMQGSTNIFTTMRCAARYLRDGSKWHSHPTAPTVQAISASLPTIDSMSMSEISRLIFRMLHKNPLDAFRIRNTGELLANFSADFFLMKQNHEDPYENLLQGNPWDIQFLCVDGKPTFGDPSFASLFHFLDIPYETITLQKKHTKILRIPQGKHSQFSLKEILSRTPHKKNPFNFLYS